MTKDKWDKWQAGSINLTERLLMDAYQYFLKDPGPLSILPRNSYKAVWAGDDLISDPFEVKWPIRLGSTFKTFKMTELEVGNPDEEGI
jgi:hypothetical protein